MAVPQSRDDFKEYCLRALGKPVIEINVADEQVDDRVDFALQTFYDYHYEGSDKTYYKYQIGPNNHSTSIYDITITNGGTGYTNGAALTISGGEGNDANVATGTILTTNSTGGITALSFTNGGGYANIPTVTAPGGTGAILTAQLGGFIPLPQNIIGVTDIFDVGIGASASNILFNLRYQIVLNDLYMFNNLNVVPYYVAMQNVSLIEEVLVGKQPLRFNRYQNKLYIDMDWSQVADGTFIVVEAYQVIDPAIYSEVWSNRWLQEYTQCLIKKQWGNNLKKFQGMTMPGGVSFNGQAIFDEAVEEEKALMYELVNTYSLPTQMFVG